MRFGFGFGFGNRHVGEAEAGPFTPASLSGLVGWYAGTDTASMFQNSGGTGAVAADDPVGRWVDKSGSGNHLIQTSATARPLYRSGGYLDFDGSNDFLMVAAPAFPLATLSMWWVAEESVQVNGPGVWAFVSSAGHDAENSDSLLHTTGNIGGTYLGIFGNTTGTSLNITVAGSNVMPKDIYELHISGGTATLYRNGSSVGSDSSFSLAATNGGAFYVGTRFFSAATQTKFNGNIHELVVSENASSEDRTNMNTYLATEHSISL